MKKVILLFIVALISFNAFASEEFKNSLMPSFASIVYDKNGKILGFFYKDKFRLYTSIKDVPPYLIKAVVATEDERFFEHKGVDPISILRAAIADIKSGRIVQGGSTITQQLAKIIYLSPEKTLSRKLKEAAIARELEKKLTKMEILELYLNYIYLSNGAYGVRSASWVLFGKEDPSQLTLAESALIAGIIRGPEYYNPFKHPDRALRRRNFVLKKMLNLGLISKEEYLKAIKEPLTPLKKPNVPNSEGYVLDLVKFEISRKKILPLKDLYSAGLEIKTTVDLRIQKFAQSVLTKYTKMYAEKHNVENLQCAGFAIDKEGRVLFVVGGTDFKETPLNRAFRILRPIGSTAKPITYLTAFQNGWSPLDFVSNEPLEIFTGKFWWRPENYSGRFSPFVRVRTALIKSINVATLRLAMHFPQKVRRNMIKFELISRSADFDLSYILGSFPANLYRIVRAYSAFQDKGILKEPFVISEIRTKEGKLVYRGLPVQKVVSDVYSVEILRSILEDVVKVGTARRISYLTKWFDVAGKTGTTNDFRDVYFTGFTTSFTMSVWFGRDDYEPLWERATGGGTASPAWGEIAEYMCRLIGCGRFVPPAEEIKKRYPPPTHFPEEEMKEIYYDEFINKLGEDEEDFSSGY